MNYFANYFTAAIEDNKHAWSFRETRINLIVKNEHAN